MAADQNSTIPFFHMARMMQNNIWSKKEKQKVTYWNTKKKNFIEMTFLEHHPT